MAGIAKDIQASEMHQGPGDLWLLATAPADNDGETPPVAVAPLVVLASDGTPDAATHGASVHLGIIASALTTQVRPKHNLIELEQYDAPFDSVVADVESTVMADIAQMDSVKLAHALGVGTSASGSGYKQVTFGGTLALPEVCVAAISQRRVTGTKYLVSCLFKAVAAGGFQIAFGRSKMASAQVKFLGLADLDRTVGQQVGVIFETLTNAALGTPTAKSNTVADIYQGQGDLWLIDAAPINATKRVTIDATTLTPDATAHADSKHLGATAGEITLTVTSKVGVMKIDQSDGPIGAFIEGIEAKIEAEMTQSECSKLASALGIGTFGEDTDYRMVTWGGVDQPTPVCIAAIAKKRSDATKVGCFCLYNVQPVSGIEITMSRKKMSTYKVSFTGLLDLTRTAGSQMGIFHEMV